MLIEYCNYIHFTSVSCRVTPTRLELKKGLNHTETRYLKVLKKNKTASICIRSCFLIFVTPKVQMSNSFIEDVKKIVALKFNK
jgi:hypothetical protein